MIFALAGCETTPKPAPPAAPEVVSLKKLSPSSYPNFADDLDYDNLGRAIAQSIAYLQVVPPQREYEFGRDRVSAAHILKSLQRFQGFIQGRPPARSLQDFIRDNYLVYQSPGRNAQDEVLFTGYYEPLLRGSRSRKPEYAYPVYPRPEDLVTVDLGAFSEKFKGEKITGRLTDRALVPYYERREIEEDGVLYGKIQPIAWVNDPVDLFFLHIQGSGKIALDDGQTINAHYDGGNGRPYRSIGQLLIDEGKISREEMSMQRIRAYLRENPFEIQRVLNYNPSYIFFKIGAGGRPGRAERQADAGPVARPGPENFPARSADLHRDEKAARRGLRQGPVLGGLPPVHAEPGHGWGDRGAGPGRHLLGRGPLRGACRGASQAPGQALFPRAQTGGGCALTGHPQTSRTITSPPSCAAPARLTGIFPRA